MTKGIEKAKCVINTIISDYEKACRSGNVFQQQYTSGMINGALEIAAVFMPREARVIAES
jgi:hypothetical protein